MSINKKDIRAQLFFRKSQRPKTKVRAQSTLWESKLFVCEIEKESERRERASAHCYCLHAHLCY